MQRIIGLRGPWYSAISRVAERCLIQRQTTRRNSSACESHPGARRMIVAGRIMQNGARPASDLVSENQPGQKFRSAHSRPYRGQDCNNGGASRMPFGKFVSIMGIHGVDRRSDGQVCARRKSGATVECKPHTCLSRSAHVQNDEPAHDEGTVRSAIPPLRHQRGREGTLWPCLERTMACSALTRGGQTPGPSSYLPLEDTIERCRSDSRSTTARVGASHPSEGPRQSQRRRETPPSTTVSYR